MWRDLGSTCSSQEVCNRAHTFKQQHLQAVSSNVVTSNYPTHRSSVGYLIQIPSNMTSRRWIVWGDFTLHTLRCPSPLAPSGSCPVEDEPYHLKCTWLRNPEPPPPSPATPSCTSPWAFCVICWDLNLLLLFIKSTAIKIGLQLCLRLPNDIRAWNIFWLFSFCLYSDVCFFAQHVATRQAGMILNFWILIPPPTLPKTHPAGQPICGAFDIRINLIIQDPVSMLCSNTSDLSETGNSGRIKRQVVVWMNL